MRFSRAALSLIVCLLSLDAIAQSHEMRVGGLEGHSKLFATAGTIIDWSRPASMTGTVDTAHVGWTNATAPCAPIFYVRFYAIPVNALAAVMVAERGPFSASNGIVTVALDPPVDVFRGQTYIGIRRVEAPENCGIPYGTFTRTRGRALSFDGNFTGPFSQLNPLSDYTLQAMATSGGSARVATIPAVASAPGNFGSFFRTALTLSNPTALEVRGKLVMRLAGRAGTDADPSLDYVIPPNGTLNYADVVDTMDQSGLGSIDIITTGSTTPIATARVYNDGANGTSGFNEEAIPAGGPYLSNAVIFIPEDLTNFRLNIGIRTMDAVTLNGEVRNAAGQGVHSFNKSYPAHYFEQVGAAAFINGGSLPAGGKIIVSAFEKEFLVYGAATDNRTNDPSMRIGLD